MIVYCSWRQAGVRVPSWLPASTAAGSLCKGRSTSPAFNSSLAMSLSEMQPSWGRFGWLCAFPHGQKDSSKSSTRIGTGTEKQWHDRLHSTLERGSKRWIKYSCTHIEKSSMPPLHEIASSLYYLLDLFLINLCLGHKVLTCRLSRKLTGGQWPVTSVSGNHMQMFCDLPLPWDAVNCIRKAISL